MRGFFNKLIRGVREVYQKAEDLLESERELPLSQTLINAAIKRFVTEKVEALQDLHTDIHDDWLRLYATVDIQGIYASLAADLNLVQLQLDKDVQRLVFEQRSETQVLELKVGNPIKRLGVKLMLWVFRSIGKDPLGFVLSKLEIITVKNDLFYVDLAKFLADNPKVIGTLRRVQLNHAVLREEEFVLKASVNLNALFGGHKDVGLTDEFGEPSKLEQRAEAQTLNDAA